MEEQEVRCPYCNSKDLSKVPPAFGSAPTNSIVYRCQMCSRTFSKTSQEKKEE